MPEVRGEAAHHGSGENLLLIVAGAHLRAERMDRALCYRLRDEIDARRRHGGGGAGGRAGEMGRATIEAVVCTDLWFLNQPDLLERPAIAVGGPGVNAATAHFANRLPVVFMIEGALEVRMDLEARVPAASMWGVDHAATAAAVDAFVERHLDGFLKAVEER